MTIVTLNSESGAFKAKSCEEAKITIAFTIQKKVAMAFCMFRACSKIVLASPKMKSCSNKNTKRQMGAQNSVTEKTSDFLVEHKTQNTCNTSVDNWQSITVDGSDTEMELSGDCNVEISNVVAATAQCDMDVMAEAALDFANSVEQEQTSGALSGSVQNSEIDVSETVRMMTEAITSCQSELENTQEITMKLPKKITCDGNARFFVGNEADLASTCLLRAASAIDAKMVSESSNKQKAEGLLSGLMGPMIIVGLVVLLVAYKVAQKRGLI